GRYRRISPEGHRARPTGLINRRAHHEYARDERCGGGCLPIPPGAGELSRLQHAGGGHHRHPADGLHVALGLYRVRGGDAALGRRLRLRQPRAPPVSWLAALLEPGTVADLLLDWIQRLVCPHLRRPGGALDDIGRHWTGRVDGWRQRPDLELLVPWHNDPMVGLALRHRDQRRVRRVAALRQPE